MNNKHGVMDNRHYFKGLRKGDKVIFTSGNDSKEELHATMKEENRYRRIEDFLKETNKMNMNLELDVITDFFELYTTEKDIRVINVEYSVHEKE